MLKTSPVCAAVVQNPSMEIGPEQKPSLQVVSSRGIVAMDEDSDHKEHVVVREGQLQSYGGPKDDLGGVKRAFSSSSTDTLCGTFLRKLKISFPLGRPHGIPKKSPNPTQNHPGKGRGKRIHWDLCNFFTHSKQRHQEKSSGHHEKSSGHQEKSPGHHKKSSGRSTNQPEYRLVRDPDLPPYFTVPPQDERLKLLWKLTDSELRHHANISMIVEAPQETEESIPLLGYPEVLIKPYGVGARHSAKAIAPPWILWKWRMKDSRKLLKIYPEKEILFHRTDDVNETYSSSITLQNKTKGFVAFKFKGTYPHVFTMKPKHGLLGPNLAITVDAFRYGDPFLPSGRKKDLFVVMTVPVPASLVKNNAVSSLVFRRFEDQCRCEGVLRAIYSLPEIVPEIKSYESEVDEQVRMDALYRSLILSRLTSIPETEPGH